MSFPFTTVYKSKHCYAYFFQVVKVKPSDKDARAKFNECGKIVKRIAFEKAIAVEEKPVSETIDLESLSMYNESCFRYIMTKTFRLIEIFHSLSLYNL